MRRLAKAKAQREPTIALINIVFLMLVFFMVAGTLAQPMDADMSLVETHELDGRAPPNALLIHPDGQLSFQGRHIANPTAYIATLQQAELDIIRLVPDRALPAKTLVSITRDLRQAGAKKVMIVTKRGLQ